MSKKKSVIFDTQKLVNHGELRVLVDHISAMMTALTARVAECERTRPVDPAVKEAGDALIAQVRASSVMAERALMLVPDDEEQSTESAPIEPIDLVDAAVSQLEADHVSGRDLPKDGFGVELESDDAERRADQ